jgi:hypothetical protein
MKRDDATRAYLAALGPAELKALKEIEHCCGNIDMLRGQIGNLTYRRDKSMAIDLAEARWAIHVAEGGHELSNFPALTALRAVLGELNRADRRLIGMPDED